VNALAKLPLARLGRTRRGWLSAGAWAALAVALAVVTRRQGSAHGADRVLLEGYASYALPLLAYAIVGATLGGASMKASTAPLVAFGAAPGRAAAMQVLVAAAGCAVSAALLGAAVAAVAHGSADPPVARDALTSAYAGGLGGLAYASWFALGASFGRAGGGRMALLFADFVVSGDDGALAALTPRGHVRSLLGGLPVLEWPERASAAALVALTVVYAALAIARARPGK
jgi:hypothetical protein